MEDGAVGGIVGALIGAAISTAITRSACFPCTRNVSWGLYSAIGGAVGGAIGGIVSSSVNRSARSSNINFVSIPKVECADNYFYVPRSVERLVLHAKQHFKQSIDFTPNGVSCPERRCKEGPFRNSHILFVHILNVHKKVKLICGHCTRTFKFSDNLVSGHAELEHGNISSAEMEDSLIDITIPILSREYPTLKLCGTPKIGSYDEYALLIQLCRYPETSAFVKTDSTNRSMLRACFESRIVVSLSKKMICKFATPYGICEQKFQTCRELAYHVTTHTNKVAFCKYCYETFDNIQDAAIHMAENYFECITCNCRFNSIQSVLGHRNEINIAVYPYINDLEDKTLMYCDLFLPNYANHGATTEIIDLNTGINENHPCTRLYESLVTSMNNAPLRSKFEECVKNCLEKDIVEYPQMKKCEYCVDGRQVFSYKYCRQLLLHMLFKHTEESSAIRFICDLCMLFFIEKETLHDHIKEHHPGYICEICLISFGTKLILKTHQHTKGHHLVQALN